MKMKTHVLNADKELERLQQLQRQSAKGQSKLTVVALKNDLQMATPVDTGLARRSWKVVEGQEGHDVVNTVSYIQYLNAGSSRQAPAHFVEAIALVYGRPLGTIVDVIQE